MMMQRGLWVMSGCLVGVLGGAASAQAPSTDPGMTLALREAKNGEIAFGGPVDQFSHRFTIVAQTAEPVALVEVRVPDFTDGTGKQTHIRWSWIGAQPRAIDVRRPAEILLECSLPAPGIYSTVIEVLYASRDATGKDLIKPLRVPLRFERTAAVPPTSPPELPITALAVDTFEATMFWGSATAEVDLALRGTGATVIRVDKAIPLAVPRKGSGSQLIRSNATATLQEGIPADVPRDDVHKVKLDVANLEQPGTYEGKVLFGSSVTGAFKEVSFTILVKRSILAALAVLTFGVLLSMGTRSWFQRGRARARARRDLSRLRDELSRIARGELGDTEANAAAGIAQNIYKLLGDLDDTKNAALESAVDRLWRRVTLLQGVVEARHKVALLPTDRSREPRLGLDSIAAALAASLDEAQLSEQESNLRKLDLEKILHEAMLDVAKTLRARLNKRSDAHRDHEAQWKEVQASLDDAGHALKNHRVIEARGLLLIAARKLTSELGDLLRELAATPPPHVAEAAWQVVRADLDRLLEKLDQSDDAEQAAELHARALTRFLRVAAPALAAAADSEAQELAAVQDESSTQAALENLAVAARALLAQPDPDADDAYRALLEEYTRLVPTREPEPSDGLELAGAPRTVAVPAVQVRESNVASQLSVLRTVLPSTETLTARLTRSNKAADAILFVLAVLSGLQVLWNGNPTWGNWGDLLAAFLWAAGVHSVGQQVARGVLGLKTDFSKAE